MHVQLLLPLVRTTRIQFGVMCYRWIVVIFDKVDHGCITRMELMACAITHTFMHGGKQVTLHPMKLEPSNIGLRTRPTKEALQIHTVYKSNVKKYRVRGQTLFQPGENDAIAPIYHWRQTRGPYVGPKEI